MGALDLNLQVPAFRYPRYNYFNRTWTYPDGAVGTDTPMMYRLMLMSNEDLAKRKVSLNTDPADKLNNTTSLASSIGSEALGLFGDLSSLFITSGLNDTEGGQVLGKLFGSSTSSLFNTLGNNLLKGAPIAAGLGHNIGSSLGGTAAGIASHYLGRGITELGGNTALSQGIGTGVGTALGGFTGKIFSNLGAGESALKGLDIINATKNVKKATDAFKAAKQGTEAYTSAAKALKAAKAAKTASLMNWGNLAASALGEGLSAAFGPSKEYSGKYGNITAGMDTAYSALSGALNFIPGGLLWSGITALNKGLSNVFGSTSGMTVQDAILGSAFMPFFVKWLNMAGAKTTSTFNNQSWQNTEKTNAFMQDAYGNLGERFDTARTEAGKTYGTFSRSAYNKALDNIDFANVAWDKILELANQNEYQNIRSLDMASINSLHYMQDIQGGWAPLARGKHGMKILNNQTNHNIGMRLLSAAALIDNKQMILSARGGTKVI